MRFLQTILAFLTAMSCGAAALAGPLDRAEKFRPDVYPSKVEAAAGLARRVADALNGSRGFTEADSTIVIADDDAMCDQAGAAIAQVLREQFPSAKVVVGAAAVEPADPTRISMHPRCSASDDGSGAVTLSVSGAGVERSFSAEYLDKPWVGDFARFARERAREHWIAGRSPNFASTQSDALAQARRAAAVELTPLVMGRLNVRFGARPDRVLVSQRFVTDQIEAALRKVADVEDTFVQRLESPSGEVWKASILVSASTDNIDALATHVSQVARAQAAARQARQAEQVRGWGSVAGFLAVILLLYMLINALTKGYFLWRLRAAALLLSIVGILIVLAVT